MSVFKESGLCKYMLWPCGCDECDVSIDKREDFISLSLCPWYLKPYISYFFHLFIYLFILG